jgi:3-phenylpropionate/trans-cinnamate dioxygenase ferredoxin reductase component
MNVNMWEVTEPIRQLIESRGQVDVTRLSDLDVPLTELIPK